MKELEETSQKMLTEVIAICSTVSQKDALSYFYILFTFFFSTVLFLLGTVMIDHVTFYSTGIEICYIEICI